MNAIFPLFVKSNLERVLWFPSEDFDQSFDE